MELNESTSALDFGIMNMSCEEGWRTSFKKLTVVSVNNNGRGKTKQKVVFLQVASFFKYSLCVLLWHSKWPLTRSPSENVLRLTLSVMDLFFKK